MTHYITRHDGYEYASLALATTFLVPQTVHTYYTRRMDDVSGLSLVTVLASSALWAVYMAENDLMPQVYATLFVSLNASLLILAKICLYATKPSGPPNAQLIEV